MYSARRRTVGGVVLALAVALGAGSGAATAAAPAPAVTIEADSTTTRYGHSTVLKVDVTGARSGDFVRWCVVPKGASDCGSDGSVPINASGDVTVFTKPLKSSMPVGTNRVKVFHDRGYAYTPTFTNVVVKAEKPHITVSMDRKVVAAKDVSRKRVNLYAWVGVTGVSEAAVDGKMAVYVDGKRATSWTPIKRIAIPGSTNKKPAIKVNIPVAPLKRRGNHVIEVKYQASGAAATVVGTGVHTSVRRTFQTQ